MNPIDLYKEAKDKYPAIYEVLLNLDKRLAELHNAGMDIQRERLYLLHELTKSKTDNYIIEKLNENY
jgi:hypothetical protein